MDLLERDAPLAVLQECWKRASSGQGNVVAITGEAGIGKTSLSLGFCETLPGDARLFRGGCEDFSVAEPLGPLLDIASQAGWSVPGDISDSGAGHSVLGEALEAFAHPTVPTAILIEDLHWADGATLDFLRFASRRLREYRVLILVTSRDAAQEGRVLLRKAFGDAPADCVTRIELSPLSEAAVRDLSDRFGKDADTVFNETGGNPFYVSELLRAEGGAIPRSVEDAVLARVGRLGDNARNLMEACSVFPRRVELDTIRTIVGEGFTEALDACLSSGLLCLNPPYLEFRHDLARRAVESALSWAKRVRRHQQALEALSAVATTPKPALLHHAIRAEATEGIGALAQAAAAEAERLNSNREAAQYFQIAIETAKGLSPSQKAALLEKCAWNNHLAGNFMAAIDIQQQAVDLFRETGNQIALGEGLWKLGRYQWFGSASRQDPERSIRAALDCLSPFPGPELAMAQSSLSQLLMLAWEYEPAIHHAEQAIAYARESGRDDILGHAYNNLGTSLIWMDPERGRSLLAESIAIAERTGRFDDAVRGYINWSEFEFRRLDYEHGRTLAKAGIEICREHNLQGRAHYLLGIHAWNLLSLGRWEEARSVAETGLKPMADGSRTQGNFPPAIAYVQLMSRTGSGDDDHVVEELAAARQWTDQTQHLWIYATVVAERAWLGLGEVQPALELLREVLKETPADHMVPDVVTWLHRLDPSFEADPLAVFDAPHRLLLSGHWQAAADEWNRLGAPYDRALALSEGDAAARLQAIDILEGLGATAVVARIGEAMRRDGQKISKRGPRQTTRDNPLGLTKRQMDVLGLLNDGLSNAQIAERLFVSPKTVDHHVSAILGKLEASTRGEAVAKARALEIPLDGS